MSCSPRGVVRNLPDDLMFDPPVEPENLPDYTRKAPDDLRAGWHTGEGGVKFRYDDLTEELYVRIPANVLAILTTAKFTVDLDDACEPVLTTSTPQASWSAYTALRDIINTILFWHR